MDEEFPDQTEDEFLELKYQLEVMYSKFSELQEESEKLERLYEDLRSSAADDKEKIGSLQKINENLYKLRDDLKEENKRVKAEVEKELQRSAERELEMTRERREDEKQRKIDQEKIQQLECEVITNKDVAQRASKEHEKDKEEQNKSAEKKDQKILQLEARLSNQEREHEKDTETLKKLVADKDEELSKQKAWFSLQKREHEKLSKANGKKVQELKVSLGQSTKECEDLQNKSKKLEADKEILELSIAEKEQILITLRSEHEKRVQELTKEIKEGREADQKKAEELQISLARGKQEFESFQTKAKKLEKERNEFVVEKEKHENQAKEKDKEVKEMAKAVKGLEERLSLQKIEHEQEKEADGKKSQELQMSLVCKTKECEALQNKSRKLEKEKEDLELSIAEKEQSLLIQREEDKKQAHEMTSRIEEKVKITREQMSRLTEERQARETKRAAEDLLFKKELNRAKDSLKHYREKIEVIKNAVAELSTDLKTTKSDGNSNEKVANLCKAQVQQQQVQQYVLQIEALKEENVVLKKELERNESALNAGFVDHKILSERYNALKSKFSRMQKIVGGT